MVPTAKELKQEEKTLGDREMTLEELQAKTASYANKRADEKDLFLAFEQVFAYDAQGLCRNIKQARLEANLSEDELAAKANISVKVRKISTAHVHIYEPVRLLLKEPSTD